MNWRTIVIKNNVLKDLIVSLEEYAGQPVDETTKEQLEQDLDAIDTAQVSLEAYCNAYNLCNMLNESNTLSMESYSAIMTLAESNKSMPACLNISLEDETSPSMLKNIKDKIIAAFKWLMEKIGNLFSRLRAFISKSLTGMKDRSSKIASWFKEATGFKKDVHINVDDIYLIVKDNNNLYSAKEIENAVEYLYTELPEACAAFIEDSVKNIPTEVMHWNEKTAPDIIKKTFSEKSKKSFFKVVAGRYIRQADGTINDEMYKVNGVNVGIVGGFVTAINGKEINEDIVVGTMHFDKNNLKEINPNISIETISITTRDFNKVRDLAEMLESEIEKYQKEFEKQKVDKINKSLENLKNELMDVLMNKGFKSEDTEERAAIATQNLMTTLITRNLEGAFELRAKSEQAATQVLACTNKLLWKVYKVETSEMSDSKELVVA